MHTLKRRDFLKVSAVVPLAPLLASCADEHSIRIDDSLPVGPFGATDGDFRSGRCWRTECRCNNRVAACGASSRSTRT